MTKEGWRRLILDLIANDDNAGVSQLAGYLEEVDTARQELRNKGYGVIGTPILDQVREIPSGWVDVRYPRRIVITRGAELLYDGPIEDMPGAPGPSDTKGE